MAWITFNRIYIGLIIMAVVSAMVVPKPFFDKGRAQIQRIFTPVTYPLHSLAAIATRRMQPPLTDIEQPAASQRTYSEIAQENRELRLEVAALAAQLRKLQEINAERERIGPIRELCLPLRVTGSDSGYRKALTVQGSIEGMRAGMAVLYPGGLVGRLDRVGWSGGAQVQLITDRGFRITARFGRFGTAADGTTRYERIGEVATLFEGDGRNGMVCRILSMKQVRDLGLRVGDWAVVADNDYPRDLQGYRLGIISAIQPSRAGLEVAEIYLRPQEDLLTLREVMVLVK